MRSSNGPTQSKADPAGCSVKFSARYESVHKASKHEEGTAQLLVRKAN